MSIEENPVTLTLLKKPSRVFWGWKFRFSENPNPVISKQLLFFVSVEKKLWK